MNNMPVKLLPLLLVTLMVTGCAQNNAWRTKSQLECTGTPSACDDSYIELHNDHNYELAYVEFSEVGNAFSSDRTREVLNRIEGYAASEDGVAVIVFVHGWKHNASAGDTNVHSFRDVLKTIAASGSLGKRKLVGLYVGWRGKSIYDIFEITENLTFWDRKAVAEEVGKGGVTGLFLKLDNIDRRYDKKNVLLIVGHSFGGAITLSALHDVLLTRLTETESGKQITRFGEGIILINPAIEANQILELKEASMRFRESPVEQPELLHVISSKNDRSTNTLFPLGQLVGVGLTWDHNTIQRTYENKQYRLSEFWMDLETIGNHDRFFTGEIIDDKKSSKNLAGKWRYNSFCSKSRRDGPEENTEQPNAAKHDPPESRLPCSNNDPIIFLTTSGSFIGDHNDVFNINVKAYLSTIVSEALADQGETLSNECKSSTKKSFDFTSCFNLHYRLLLNNGKTPG